jgi:endonuclease I
MNLRQLLVILFLFNANSFASLSDHKYYPTNLIDKVEISKIKDEQLKEELYKVLAGNHLRNSNGHDSLVAECKENQKCYKQVTTLTYKTARKYLFGKLHLEKNTSGSYFVKDAYCNKEIGSRDGVGPMQIPNHQVINCEHTWPQSRFNPKESTSLQKTDLHHLFPVNMRANSTRSNHIFAEVNGRPINSQCQDSQKGMAIGSSVSAFEPPTEHKGNVARALFYFSTRYKIAIGPLEEEYLRRWNIEDPVDSKELARNNAIETIQHNRNPFIDEPKLVDQINNF